MSEKPEKTAFELDTRVVIKLDWELASALGRLILGTDTDNTALLALGHRLMNDCNRRSI